MLGVSTGMRPLLWWFGLVALAPALLAACRDAPEAPAAPAPAGPGVRGVTSTVGAVPALREVAHAAGIAFRHENGAFGRKYLPETMGSGVAILDYDGDGWEDLLFVNGTGFPGQDVAWSTFALYRNAGDGALRFTNETVAAGLAVEAYGMGVATADADDDGDVDVFVTCLGPNLFFENLGDGTFRERAAELGLSHPGFGASAAWLDADGDGLPDLFVTNYVEWTPETDIHCSLDGRSKAYCTPESYRPARCLFYGNQGGLRFEDRSLASGVGAIPVKALGVATLDYDGDGRLDVAVACDTYPNLLFRSRGDGTFEETGVDAGIAFSEAGTTRGAMGIDAADYDGSGRPSLVIGNFSNQMLNLYRNEGPGHFVDEAPATEVGEASLLTLAFPCFFTDFDLDGWPDIFVGNGHVEPEISKAQPEVAYAEPPHVLLNLGAGSFRDVAAAAGLTDDWVVRGGAFGDLDGDGDPDIVLSQSGGRALLIENRLDRPGRALVLSLRDRLGREAIGAKIEARVADRVLTRWVTGGGSYLSSSTRKILLGLGEATEAKITVTWPDGTLQSFPPLPGGRAYLLDQTTPTPTPLRQLE